MRLLSGDRRLRYQMYTCMEPGQGLFWDGHEKGKSTIFGRSGPFTPVLGSYRHSELITVCQGCYLLRCYPSDSNLREIGSKGIRGCGLGGKERTGLIRFVPKLLNKRRAS